MFSLVPLVVLFPLAGFGVNALFGRRLGPQRSGVLAVAAAVAAFGIALTQLAALAGAGFEPWTGVVAEWLSIGDFQVRWAFQVDTLSVTMMLVVAGVGSLIHVYALGYMREDVHHNGDPARYPRFFVYLNLFLASMLVLVGADNFLMLFVGWEGVGLCSYLLIGFWFEKGADNLGNARAAMKAFVVNRVGDFGLLLAMFLIYWNFHSLNFAEVFAAVEEAGPAAAGALTAITLLLLLGATGKSAQLPLYVWLPDAMAGPTPVSALIHAATMVTAGIYMITRTHVLFAAAPFSMEVVAWIGAATALFAATIAVAQMDIKRVLAYSTISQLGFMIAAVGLGGYVAGMFHLVTHAFFKALLFLSAGSVIQAVERGAHQAHDHSDPQDMRNMGGLWGRLPVTQWVHLIGALALAGLPPLSGFFSKDEILLDAFEHNPAIYALLTAAAFLTAFYMGRQMLMVFFGKPRTAGAAQATESPAVITGPLMILAALSIFGGALNLPGAGVFGRWLDHTLHEGEALPFNWLVAGVSTGLALAALGLAYALYGRAYRTAQEPDPLHSRLGPLFGWLRDKWYVDELYGFLIVKPFTTLAYVTARAFDLGGVDMTFNNLGELARAVAGGLSRFQLGYARRYALVMFVGVVAVLAYFLVAR
ncbi:MAG: NADH-quinone oxidoreductase subunit L [Anaerolineales bacterium]|nr:NADH-quinone oxidoreductase subunit L [Anaerolineales bacterium]